MRAVCWNGVDDLRTERVPDPEIVNPCDAIVKVRLSSVCGSDLHLLEGSVPGMRPGDVIGHEFLGEVVETGREVAKLRRGDRVVVVPVIACGRCWFCERDAFSACDNSNPNPGVTGALYGHATPGIFGHSHAFGGYAGSHAEYVRVPFADTNAIKVPNGVRDEQAVFVSDAAPTGFYGADLCGIEPGDVVAVWGCGGVGQMAIASARLLGAERVIAIDRLPERLEAAASRYGADIVNYEQADAHEMLLELTGGRGPDRCIDAVGMGVDGTARHQHHDKAETALMLATDRASVLRAAIRACRKGGTVSVIGVYGGLIDRFPMGAIVNKALTIRSGQQPGQRYAERLFGYIQDGRLDPSWLLTHRLPLEQGAEGYAMFERKTDGCLRVVFDPDMLAQRV